MATDKQDTHDSAAARLIGRSRLIVLVAVVAVLLAAFSLFLLGAIIALKTVAEAWQGVLAATLGPTDLTVRFLEIVSVMLKAVVFYLIGVGFYSLFISPLNLTVAMGIETLNDLETKIISVVIVIMAVHFLQRFIQHQDALDLVLVAGALAMATAALVYFKVHSFREAERAKTQRTPGQKRAREEMFRHAHEEHDIQPEEPRENERRPH
ncbi:MAG: YqhA family protein [Pseudomonadota bacterium]|nr:MAG: hypothetical protein DIU74_03220 [Pseudomonadota bacterium]